MLVKVAGEWGICGCITNFLVFVFPVNSQFPLEKNASYQKFFTIIFLRKSLENSRRGHQKKFFLPMQKCHHEKFIFRLPKSFGYSQGDVTGIRYILHCHPPIFILGIRGVLSPKFWFKNSVKWETKGAKFNWIIAAIELRPHLNSSCTKRCWRKLEAAHY